MSYATSDDLTTWLSGGEYPLPPDPDRILDRASDTIRWFTAGTYDTTLTPLPQTILDALRDATCAQVEQWCETGESVEIASMRPDTTFRTEVDGQPAELSTRAARILAGEGILNTAGYAAALDGIDAAPIGVTPI